MKPTGFEVLKRARGLIAERGWSPVSTLFPYGRETGPLHINEALWRGCLWTDDDNREMVALDSVATASRGLVAALGGNQDLRFAELSAWGAEPGRVVHEVLALFDAVILGANRAAVAEMEQREPWLKEEAPDAHHH